MAKNNVFVYTFMCPPPFFLGGGGGEEGALTVELYRVAGQYIFFKTDLSRAVQPKRKINLVVCHLNLYVGKERQGSKICVSLTTKN